MDLHKAAGLLLFSRQTPLRGCQKCYQFNIPPKLLCYACLYTELGVLSCWAYILENEMDAESKVQKSVNKKNWSFFIQDTSTKIVHFLLKYSKLFW